MKNIFTIILALFVGFLISFYIFKQYDSKENIKTVFSDTYKLNFFQYGVYSSEESMKENTSSLNYYIYNVIDNKYYVYIGITKKENTTEKIKGYFTDLGYDVYVKQMIISDTTFVTALEQYEILLENTEDKNTIKTIISQILSEYEELKNE